MKAVDLMARRQHMPASHVTEGGEALAGVLTRELLEGPPDGTDRGRNRAVVYTSEEATIQYGCFTVYTDKAALKRGSSLADQYVYVPFVNGTGHNACVMKVKHVYLIRLAGMGWPDDEARIAVGKMYDQLSVRTGLGMEDHFSDDLDAGPRVFPRMIYAPRSRMKAGYPWAVFLRQIRCPVAHLPGTEGATFVTLSKMGYHGRLDHEQYR